MSRPERVRLDAATMAALDRRRSIKDKITNVTHWVWWYLCGVSDYLDFCVFIGRKLAFVSTSQV
jgi:hypothetical protein